MLWAHLQTWRLHESASFGLLGVAGALLTDGSARWTVLLTAWIVPTLLGVGAQYLGDYLGRHGDAVGKPHRPIPSGVLSCRVALGCALGCFVVGTAWALCWSLTSVAVIAVALAGSVAYARRLKNRGVVGDLVMGFSSLAPMVLFGALVTSSPPTAAAVLAALAAGVHGTVFNLLLSLADVHGDRRAGWGTLAVRRGSRTVVRVVGRLLPVSLLLAASVLAVQDAPWGALILLFLAAVLDYEAPRVLTPGFGRTEALTAVRRNLLARVLLGGVFVVAAGGGVVLMVLTGGVVWASEHWLMNRHELGPETGTPPTIRLENLI